MKSAKLIILDEVNVKFVGLEPSTRSKMMKAVEFFVPGAIFSPAYKMGRWNGKVSLMQASGATFLHVLDRLTPILDADNYHIDIEDMRKPYDFSFTAIDETYLSDVVFAKGHQNEGETIKLRPHQVKVVNSFLENRHGISVACTGSGKTLICAALSRKVQDYGRSIVIVPSADLVIQTEKDYKLVGLDCGVYYGERKELNKMHTICTWQSLGAIAKRSTSIDVGTFDDNDRTEIQDFIDGVVCIIVDECHTSKADVLKAVLSGPMKNIPLRWGLTGTIPKDDQDSLMIRCNVGNVVSTVKASELQEQGILSKCQIKILQLASKLKFNSYQDELAYLLTDDTRLDYIAMLVQQISESGNTLILLDRVEAGKKLLKKLNLPSGNFISGSSSKKERASGFLNLNTGSNEIYISTFKLCSTGINVPRIFNLVFIEAGKSFIKTIQSIGRGLRVAKDKNHVEIYDICGTNKYAARHTVERINFYNESEYPYTKTVISDWEEYTKGKGDV